MPQANNSTTKKKKGRTPAHQNTYAFYHNPNSKETLKILASPNQGVCKRCHDKIEWRKKYRKYKPRTQPGSCNKCKRRNVLAAYHTLCSDCSTAVRICAMCTKDVTHNKNIDEEDEDKMLEDQMIQKSNENDGRRLKLREIKSIQREIQKGGVSEKGDSKGGQHEKHDSGEKVECNLDDEDDDNLRHMEENTTTDLFMEAIGGAQNLVVGVDYQNKILEQDEENNRNASSKS